MASLAKVYKIKWYGPYKEKDLPKRKSNIVYLWVGKRKSNPSVKYCVPQYCGITGRGVYRFFEIVSTRLFFLQNFANTRSLFAGIGVLLYSVSIPYGKL